MMLDKGVRCMLIFLKKKTEVLLSNIMVTFTVLALLTAVGITIIEPL